MSDNHVDIFMNARDEISISESGDSTVIQFGGTAKIFLISKLFTLDAFMNKLNETYRQATARKESKNAKGREATKATTQEKRERIRKT